MGNKYFAKIIEFHYKNFMYQISHQKLQKLILPVFHRGQINYKSKYTRQKHLEKKITFFSDKQRKYLVILDQLLYKIIKMR